MTARPGTTGLKNERMRKFTLLFFLILVTQLASAQDYILKNWIDYFSIMKDGHGVSITGDDIKDSQGNYFLKGLSGSSPVTKSTGFQTVTGHYLVAFSDWSGQLVTDPVFEYNPIVGNLKVNTITTNLITGPNFSVSANAIFGNVGTYSDGVGSGRAAGIIFDDGLRAMHLRFFPSQLGPGLYLNYFDQGSGSEKRILTTDDLPALGNTVSDADLVHKAGDETITGQKTFNQAVYLNGNVSGQSVLETHGAVNIRSGGSLSVAGPAGVDGTLTTNDLTVGGVPKIGFTTSGGVGISFQDRNDGTNATYKWFMGVSGFSGTKFILRYAGFSSAPIFQATENGVLEDTNGYRFVTTNDFPGIANGKKAIIGDANGNIVMTNKIITSDGKDICKTPNGSWKYVHVADDGSRLVDNATVSFDGSGNATVTIP